MHRSTNDQNAVIESFLIVFLLIWTVALMFWLYIYSIRLGGIPDWDGFERCSAGAQIWYDLRHGDWDHFWHHTNRLVTWPFLHSWITGVLFTLFGPTLAAARLIALASFGGIVCLMVYSFRIRDREGKGLGLIVTWALFSTAPIAIENAATIMSEMPGLFLAMATLTFLPQEEDKPQRFALSALFLTLLFYFKYNFSALTYLGILFHRMSKADWRPRRMLTRANLILLIVPLGLFALWFLSETGYKWQNFIGFATNNPKLYTPWGWESLLYYPQRIPRAYFAVPGFFWIAVVLAAATAAWNPALRIRNPFFACFLVHFLAAAIHPMKMERFQFISMGLGFVVLGESISWGFSRLAQRFSWKPEMAFFLSALIAVPTLSYQAEEYRRPQVPQEKPYFEPLEAVLDEIETTDRVALLIPYDYICAPSVFYYYIIHNDCLEFDRREGLHRWTHIYLFRSRESILSQSEDERIEELYETLDRFQSNKVVLIECTFPPYDKNYFDWAYGGAEEIGRLIESLPRFQCLYDRVFPIHKARVRIFFILET